MPEGRRLRRLVPFESTGLVTIVSVSVGASTITFSEAVVVPGAGTELAVVDLNSFGASPVFSGSSGSSATHSFASWAGLSPGNHVQLNLPAFSLLTVPSGHTPQEGQSVVAGA